MPSRKETPETITLRPLGTPFLHRAWRKVWRGFRAARNRRRFAGFGRGASLTPPAMITGAGAIRIGDSVQIWKYARIEAFELDPGVERIVIGEGTKIQPHVHIAAARQVVIGPEVLMASHVYITDHDHDYADPEDPVVSNNRVVASPVRIERRVWLGERVMILKGVTLGESCIIGAGSIVTRDVPPFTIAVGAPARVIQRYSPETRAWERVEQG